MISIRKIRATHNKNYTQTVGYRELFDYFDGKFDLDSAIEEI